MKDQGVSAAIEAGDGGGVPDRVFIRCCMPETYQWSGRQAGSHKLYVSHIMHMSHVKHALCH